MQRKRQPERATRRGERRATGGPNLPIFPLPGGMGVLIGSMSRVGWAKAPFGAFAVDAELSGAVPIRDMLMGASPRSFAHPTSYRLFLLWLRLCRAGGALNEGMGSLRQRSRSG
uniref:Uncharacterized protein n=1 Tax=Candidatus Kentrum sp. DK TaxID=2126562 RepID=A0A450S259_9GAMM|nr:MAG: hypothetical protein BECKDK2373C_GA0170839_101247 [Candidatus Kentron sp. DK]